MVKQKPSESDMIFKLIAGAQPAYYDAMKHQNLNTFNEVNAVGLREEMSLQAAKKMTTSTTTRGYKGTRTSGGFA